MGATPRGGTDQPAGQPADVEQPPAIGLLGRQQIEQQRRQLGLVQRIGHVAVPWLRPLPPLREEDEPERASRHQGAGQATGSDRHGPFPQRSVARVGGRRTDRRWITSASPVEASYHAPIDPRAPWVSRHTTSTRRDSPDRLGRGHRHGEDDAAGT